MDAGFNRLWERVTGAEREIGRLGKRVTVPAQRVAAGGVASDFADGAAVDAFFLAALGVAARDGDAVIVHRESDDYLLLLVRAGGEWAGVEVAGAAVGYV